MIDSLMSLLRATINLLVDVESRAYFSATAPYYYHFSTDYGEYIWVFAKETFVDAQIEANRLGGQLASFLKTPDRS